MKKRLISAILSLALATSLFACGSASTDSDSAPSSAAIAPAADTQAEEDNGVPIDKDAFDTLVGSIETASDDEIASSEWASAVKEAGVLRVGGVRASYLFSQMDETDGSIRGFDAGLFMLLAKYILGDENAYELTQVTSATREALLESGDVDAVFATYSITPERQEVISFAGPYFKSQTAVMVKAGNSEITGVDSLAGKTVAVQAGSTGPAIVEKFAPEAIIQEFSDDAEARAALELGRADAYVTDYTLLLNAMVKNPGMFEFAGDVFGDEDPYGIGLPLDSDGVKFVNDFLKKVIEDGTWAELWKITLGDRTGVTQVPAAPQIN